MPEAYVIAVGCTKFGDHTTRSLRDLAREAVDEVGKDGDGSIQGVLADDLDSIWFGNCFMGSSGQQNIRGQAVLAALVDDGVLRSRTPVTNVEAACATGSLALHGAVRDIKSGDAEVSLAVAAEKLLVKDSVGRRDTAASLSPFSGCTDNVDPERLDASYRQLEEIVGREWTLGAGRSLFMDTYAFQALAHMARFGTTTRQLAAGAAKNHVYGSQNPLAQYRFPMTVDEVLADREVAAPLTRAMCAPLGDGAAAALVCSEAVLRGLPEVVRERAIRVRATAASGGTYGRRPEQPTLTSVAAQRAYRRAGLQASDVDVAEVHDATSFGEVLQVEMLGFCSPGSGGPFVESGGTGPDGLIPVNTSGGLVSKGHPVGATGLSMVYELVKQLRGEAGSRQVADARIGLAENGGGLLGIEEAICAITVLERVL